MSAKTNWIDCGGGAHQSADLRFYIQLSRRYLGRRAGRGVYEVSASLLDRATGKTTEHANLRAAKRAAA